MFSLSTEEEKKLRKTILPEGKNSAKIAFVGLFPSNVELAKGRPMMGPGGRVFNQCLAAADISRSTVQITNVLDFMPDNLATYFKQPKNKPAYITEEATPHIERLIRELTASQANVIVPLGEFPLQALTDKKNIGKMRGSVLPSSTLFGRKILPSLQPATVVYGNFMARYHITRDFETAKKQSLFPEIKLRPRNYIINPTSEQSLDYITDLHRKKISVSFDIEVVGNEVDCISFAPSPDEAISIPIAHYSLSNQVILWRAIAALLYDPNVIKIGQNLIFDTQFLLAHNGIRTRGEIWDTMIGHHILYPDFPKGLDFLVSYHCNGEPYYKDEGKTWRLKDFGYDWEQLWLYNAKDSALTYEVWSEIKDEILLPEWRVAYDRATALFDPLNFAMLKGVKSDEEYREQIKAKVERSIDETQAKLDKIVGSPLNVKSSPQCQAYFYGTLGNKAFTKYNKETKKSAQTTDAKAMAKLAVGTKDRPPIYEAELVLNIRSNRDRVSRNLNMKLGRDNRFRCVFNPRGTKTGRLSSSKDIDGVGGNLQNLPLYFRGFLIADEGKIIITIDKKQAEWVVSAFASGDENMIKIVQSGIDAHATSGSLICSLPIEYVFLEDSYTSKSRDSDEIEEARKLLDKEHPDWKRETLLEKYSGSWLPRRFSIRQLGKHSNHGWNYDMSSNRFMEEYETSFEEADLARKRYRYIAYPGIPAWHRKIQSILLGKLVDEGFEPRVLINPYGRRRVFYDELNDDTFREAYNFIPQSTVADNINDGITKTYFDEAEELRDYEFLIQCHDESVGQFPIANLRLLAACIFRQCKNLEHELEIEGRKFDILNEVTIGFNWRDTVKIKDISSAFAIERQLDQAIRDAREKQEKAKIETLAA